MKNVITISREFGSGGHSIGLKVAEALGYQFYDESIIDTVAEATGLNRDFVAQAGEYHRGRNMFSYAFMGRGINGLSVEDYLWQKQRELILYIADKGNCVIVGRCADYILRDRENVLNVFIHADKEYRANRIVERFGETDKKPEKRVKDKDRARKLNYQYYTGQDWGDAANYDLCIRTDRIPEEKAVDIILNLSK